MSACSKMGPTGPDVPQDAFYLFYVQSCPRSLLRAIKACSKMRDVEKGMALHSQSVLACFDSDVFISSALVHMYSTCGHMSEAQRVFNATLQHDVVSWRTLMLGYAENGKGRLALETLAHIYREGFALDSLTLLSASKACGCMCACRQEGQTGLEMARTIRAQAASYGCDTDTLLANTLVDVFSKCNSIVDAFDCFERISQRTTVSWTALLLGCAENGLPCLALELFARMQMEDGLLDHVCIVAALKACCLLAAEKDDNHELVLQKGMCIHLQATDLGYISGVSVATSLVDMYCKCSKVDHGRRVFDRMKHPNVVSWTAMISGYVESGNGSKALELFAKMGSPPNQQTYAAALKACGMEVALERGISIHADIVRLGLLKGDEVLVTSLVDFYGKCGCMDQAQRIFDANLDLSKKSTVAWTSLISGYSRHGDTDRVFELFQLMKDLDVKADGVAFLAVLVACSHAGLIDKGKGYFDLMRSMGIKPCLDHYRCMVDLLGRANELEVAVNMLMEMPFPADGATWKTVLAAAWKWKSVEFGRLAYESLVKLGAVDTAASSLMANILRWEANEQL